MKRLKSPRAERGALRAKRAVFLHALDVWILAGLVGSLVSSLVKIIAVVVLSISLGLHWLVLQTAAWGGMVVRFSQTESLCTAIEKTLDGRHPCQLCRLVQAGRADQSAPTNIRKLIRLEGCFISSKVLELPVVSRLSRIVQLVAPLKSRSEPPFLTPPRLV